MPKMIYTELDIDDEKEQRNNHSLVNRNNFSYSNLDNINNQSKKTTRN